MEAIKCTSSSAVQHQVLHTPELLEKILADSGDMRCVLLAQRVSVFWHDLIRNSSLLQSLLYFEPVAPFAPDEGLSPEELRASFAVNPLLGHCFPHWLRTPGEPIPELSPGPGVVGPQYSNCDRLPAVSGIVYFARRDYRDDENVSEFDEEEADEERGTGGGREEETGEGSSKSPVLPLFPPERRDAFTRAGASWRRMLVCQPASMGIGLKLVRPAADMPPEWYERHGQQPRRNPGWVDEGRAENSQPPIPTGTISGYLDTSIPEEGEGDEGEGEGEGGLRMGTLYDICLQQQLDNAGVWKRHRPSYLRLHWLPSGCGGLFPYHEVELRFASSTPGLGVSVFAVLEDIVHRGRGLHFHRQRTKTGHLPLDELETFRCEEHLVRKPTSFVALA
ncbi:hypothetical protein PG993_009207 [Apiospora rasikravindrae]|uniref:F-box domain-containing protein n=1 Tax=Apiospora rasikravindrae TaxID=990691 RepID=A0ABR1SIT2_9PEZI